MSCFFALVVVVVAVVVVVVVAAVVVIVVMLLPTYFLNRLYTRGRGGHYIYIVPSVTPAPLCDYFKNL